MIYSNDTAFSNKNISLFFSRLFVQSLQSPFCFSNDGFEITFNQNIFMSTKAEMNFHAQSYYLD